MANKPILSILDFYPELEQNLSAITPKLRIVFAIKAAEHAVPSYVRWAEHEGSVWGKPNLLLQAVKDAWDAVEKGEDEIPHFAELNERIALVTPDSEKFQDSSGSGAMDAAICVSHMIDCLLLLGETKFAVWSGIEGLFAADNVIELRPLLSQLNDHQQREFENERLTNLAYPLAREKERQNNLIRFLSSYPQALITRQDFDDY